MKKRKYQRLGVIGKPSDWLISSNVDYSLVKEKFGIELVNIPLKELIEEYKNINEDRIEFDPSFSKKELDKALNLHNALINVKERYNLSGLTLRCFSLLKTIKFL